MAYDELLAMRMRDAFGDLDGVAGKRMMGGVCFMLRGNMVCGADRTKEGVRRFMFRLGKANPVAETLRGGEVMAMGGRRCTASISSTKPDAAKPTSRPG